jgi:Holliday junction resolvase RusA-like endonuclease
MPIDNFVSAAENLMKPLPKSSHGAAGMADKPWAGAPLSRPDKTLNLVPPRQHICTIVYTGVLISAKVHTTAIIAKATGKPRTLIYRGKEYTEYVENIKRIVQVALHQAGKTAGPEPKPAEFSIDAFIAYKPRPRGGRVGDWDNLTKPIMDAATGLVYADDAQVSNGNVYLDRNASWEGFEASFYRVVP